MRVFPGFVAVPYAIRFLTPRGFSSKECTQWNMKLKPKILRLRRNMFSCITAMNLSGDEKEPEISNVRLFFLRLLVGLLSSSTRVDQDLKEAFEKEFGRDTDFSLNRYVCWRLGYQLDLLGNSPRKQLLYGLMAMLFGFTCASSLTLIFGALSFLDPLIAGLAAVSTELYTRYYYQEKSPSFSLRLVNAFKIGVMTGLILDAFKISS